MKMSLLYEDYASIQLGDIVTIHFETKESVEASLLEEKLERYNWTAKGLQLLKVKVHRKGGSVTVKALPTFQFVITPLMAAAVIVPAAIGLIATIVKMWTVVTVVNPLLAPGPFGFPIVFWLIIAAAGVLIPLALIMRRR